MVVSKSGSDKIRSLAVGHQFPTLGRAHFTIYIGLLAIMGQGIESCALFLNMSQDKLLLKSLRCSTLLK